MWVPTTLGTVLRAGRLNSKSLLAMLDFERKLEKVWTVRIGGGLGYSDVDYNIWGRFLFSRAAGAV